MLFWGDVDRRRLTQQNVIMRAIFYQFDLNLNSNQILFEVWCDVIRVHPQENNPHWVAYLWDSYFGLWLFIFLVDIKTSYIFQPTRHIMEEQNWKGLRAVYCFKQEEVYEEGAG